MTTVTDFFKQGGGLSDTLSHFELRAGQVELVEAIEQTLSDRTHLLAEAGTGIGKTFSYLLPTLLQDKKVVISTATKHLQEQIFFKDLPLVEKTLNKKVSVCLLKGRSNYFCHYRYEMFMGSNFALNKKQAKKVSQVQDWVDKTTSGDLSEIAVFVEEDYAFKKKITSTTENCLGGECPHFDDCFVQKVREKAKKSDVVVVNHALLMADIVLKETGFAEILPETDVVVIDEAHHLPKIATEAFAEQISARQLIELAKDALQVYQTDASDVKGFEECVEAVIQTVGVFRDALSDEQREGQVQLGQLKQLKKPYEKFKALMQAFSVFLQALEGLAERSNDLQKIYERAEITAEKIKEVFSPVPQKNKQRNTDSLSNTDSLQESTQEQIQDQEQIQEQTAQSVAILEWNEDYFRAARLPIHLGYRFQNVMESYANSWLFVSATLSVGQSFDFFIYSLGLPSDIPTLQVNSPFNYEQQSVIHILPNLPAPNHPDFVEKLIEDSVPILEKTRGRAFMLFTSYRNLYEAARLLRETDFQLFVQGEEPKSQLIDSFMQSDKAILLGTVSFWEGVDVAGEKLSCVIIDKIPFPSPGDPVIAEQSRYLESTGRSSFAHCYIPKAATLLKQGAGRLIRSQTDTGVLIFGDNRMLTKSYGRQLINALPPAKQVDTETLFTFIEDTL